MSCTARLIEEADYQSTTELFGKSKDGQRTLETFIPKSEDDFIEYAELLAQKLKPFEVSIEATILFSCSERLFCADVARKRLSAELLMPFVRTNMLMRIAEKLPLHHPG